jgi:CheY-like chemotaxis protein
VVVTSSKVVLLVDDDVVFVEALKAVLETRYRVSTAANGAEALASIKAATPDLVLLDVMMDHPSEGFDVARAIRSNPATESLPIIMLTGVDQLYDYRMETDESWVPCNRYLEKPIAPRQLLAHVAELIDR